MDIESIRTFLILADTGSFTRTSQILFLAQSTVSNRINELEKELNVKLFERTNRKVELTLQGEKFRSYARKVISLTETELPNIKAAGGKTVRIGCSNTIYACHLEKEIKKLMDEEPDTAFVISIDMSGELIEGIQNDRFDVVYSIIPLHLSGFSCEEYKADEMVLVTDSKNKKYKEISKEELIGEDYIMCDFALRELGEYIRNIFPKHHRFPVEIDDCAKVIPLIEGRNCYSFLPKDMADPLIKEKKLRKVKLKDLEAPVIKSYIIKKKGR
ncbi:MAG: LysR family transcriptional regulator [Clostridiales bacterium]|nr:LysR family transcriptional regulator [Clostridiales bacterium]